MHHSLRQTKSKRDTLKIGHCNPGSISIFSLGVLDDSINHCYPIKFAHIHMVF